MTTAEVDETNPGEITLSGHKGQPVAMRLLAHDITPDREIILVVTPDEMHAYVKIVRRESFTSVTRDEILDVAYGAGIVFGLIEDGLQLLLSLANNGKPLDFYFEIARGMPSQKGENGSVEFHVQPTSMAPRYDENESGAIDFKQLNLIENCFSGQRVASILPPGPGRAGRSVYSAEIPPVPGDPALVIPGPGVRMSSNGRDFTSEIEGRLVFEDNLLSISPHLEISQDIDYSVGNVDFVGKVIIRGSLLDGFYVHAKRGVELHGDVGASRITSEGDVKITGGIKGKSAAMITCRNLDVRYIDDASVEARGDVTVTKEIVNSSVKALGRVTVTTGKIIGGIVCGFQGVEADTLGSDMGVTTRIMAGLNWTDENRKDDLRHRIADYMERVQAAKMVLDQLFGNRDITARMGPEQKTMLADIATELRDLREMLAELLEERQRINDRAQIGMVNQINVRKMLYMGVGIRFSAVDAPVKDSIKGPLTLLQDPERRVMETKELQTMPKPPRQDELAAAEEEAEPE